MEKFITLDKQNIKNEHICCAISDKKCREGYELKKHWLERELDNGYVFRKLDARAKVFMEYVKAESGWAPIEAPGYLLINCFWVSGQYKGHGNATALLNLAVDDAVSQDMNGLVTVVGTKKYVFMSDTKWLLQHGFEECERISSGFSLLVRKIKNDAVNPKFKKSVYSGECNEKNGVVVYYSNRCPFTEYYVNHELKNTVNNRNLPLKIIKLDSMKDAQSAPSPATIFSLFYNGIFITTDLSVCLDSKFDKIISKM